MKWFFAGVLFCALLVVAISVAHQRAMERPVAPKKDPVKEEFWRLVEIGQQKESAADVVLEAYGPLDDERVRIIRLGSKTGSESDVSLREFEQLLAKQTNSYSNAVVETPGDFGFDPRPATNLASVLRTRGFSSVSVLAIRWGRMFPVTDEVLTNTNIDWDMKIQ